jgi:phosphoribosyl 1,2-cyclic phosphodiesterase
MITVETLGSSSKGNCYVLRSGGRSLLIECGLPWKEIRRKLNFETTNLDGCMASHAHGDHFRAARDLMRAGIDVFATQDTFDAVGISPNHRTVLVTTNAWFSVGKFWGMRAFDTVHDAPGSVGFLVWDNTNDHVLFITDTAYVRYKFPPVGVLMIEANYSESILAANVEAGRIEPARAKRVRENHMSIERVIDFLMHNDMSKCRAIHLLHLSDGNSNSDLFKLTVQEATGIPTFVEG